MSAKVVITGANRGIGLALTARFLSSGHEVIATARDPKRATSLQSIAGDYPDRCRVVACDVTQDESAAQLAETVAGGGHLDILVNNAGTLLEGGASFTNLTFDAIRDTFEVNVLGAMRITRALLPLLQKGTDPRVAHITSKMGSIADNSSGGFYAYRMSKAALNMFHQSFSCDYPGVMSLTLHPGWVQTDMGGKGAPVSPEDSAAGLYAVISEATDAHSGGFWDFRGQAIPW